MNGPLRRCATANGRRSVARWMNQVLVPDTETHSSGYDERHIPRRYRPLTPPRLHSA